MYTNLIIGWMRPIAPMHSFDWHFQLLQIKHHQISTHLLKPETRENINFNFSFMEEDHENLFSFSLRSLAPPHICDCTLKRPALPKPAQNSNLLVHLTVSV